MDVEKITERIRTHPHYHRVGMIASHRGVVRGVSRDGTPVKGLRVQVNPEKLREVVDTLRARRGIVDVQVEYKEGFFRPGEDILLVVVAGDTRDHVFPALVDAVEWIKGSVSTTEEVREE